MVFSRSMTDSAERMTLTGTGDGLFDGDWVRPTKPKPFRSMGLRVALMVLVAIMLGAGVGYAAAPTKVHTVQVVVPQISHETSPACLHALDEADQLNSLAQQFAESVTRTLTAIQNFDAAGIQAESATVQGLTDQVRAITPSWVSDEATCRGG